MAAPLDKIEAAERRERVMEMRRRSMTFASIGKELGVSAPRAYQIFQEALKEVPAAQVREHRTEQIELIETEIAGLMEAAKESTSISDIVNVSNSIRKWLERKARLLGLDMPVVHVNVEGGTVNYKIDGVDMKDL